MVAREQAVLVVVDRFAGAGEQAGGGVFVAEDEVGVGLAALQGDAHRHLADRAAGERVGAAERLRAQEHVDAERAALADEAVEQQRRVLGELVVGDEQLLELVDDQQRARQRRVGHGAAEAGDVLHAVLAEQLAAAAQLLVEPLEHADAELALAFDGDHAGVRQLAGGVGLELDALLEVDEVELDLIGAVVQRGIGDERVQQRRFAGARFAGDEHVLRRAHAEAQRLQLLGAGAADGDDQLAGAVVGPDSCPAAGRRPRTALRPCWRRATGGRPSGARR